RFKSCRGRGGVVKNIYIEDIVMMNIPTEPLLFDLHYGGKSAVEAAAEGASPFDVAYVEADETTPQFRDIYIKDVVCSGAARAMYFNGIPEKNIENIVVENCEIVSVKGADLRYSTGVVLRDVNIMQSEGDGYSVANCKDVVIDDCTDAAGKDTPEVFQYNSNDVIIK
ncbi:MAG: glycoside hydrolase family 28 protein, partial [Bacteroidales bacterium]|nr:glycoside hydrolase family 28 protein [Bacteroidales bacterium]